MRRSLEKIGFHSEQFEGEAPNSGGESKDRSFRANGGQFPSWFGDLPLGKEEAS